jgi:Bacterial extracellular solute-binding proteins, family 5 Middle.
MIRSQTWLSRALAISVTTMLLAACGGTTTSPSPAGTTTPGQTGTTASTAPVDTKKGGTLYLLTAADNWVDVDPQRIYTGEDLAFFGGTIYRSLESYVYSADDKEGTSLAPDLATDLGTASPDGKTWSFTLRDGVTWQTGDPLTCADVAYGVSREFATDIMGGGPSYAIQYLDIPTVKGFKKNKAGASPPVVPTSGSAYGGPYSDNLLFYSDEALTTLVPNDKAAFDTAVTCEGNTITFHLNGAHADFNYATTLGMAPVPNAKDHPGVDIGEGYGITSLPVASGPYKVESYTPGKGGSMILVRNENWKADSDKIRPAYPDRWEVQFGIDPKLIDQRLMNPSGNDETAIQYGQVQPENLATIFADANTPTAAFTGRAISGLDPYSRYWWVDINKIKNEKIRQAIGVALDRKAARTVLGGDFYGDYGDGAIKPNIGPDYADTGYYTDLFGAPIPPEGDPVLAKKLIADSGEAAPTLTWNFADTPVGQQYFAVVQSSLAKAGITVKPGAIPSGDYYKVVFDPSNELTGEFGNTGWGPDWPNASTIIAPLYTQVGGWDLSQVEDAAYETKIQDALGTLDRAAQSAKWQALNKEAVQKGWIIPTFFGRSQTLAGTKVGPVYRWPAYGSWPYGIMYVVK